MTLRKIRKVILKERHHSPMNLFRVQKITKQNANVLLTERQRCASLRDIEELPHHGQDDPSLRDAERMRPSARLLARTNLPSLSSTQTRHVILHF